MSKQSEKRWSSFLNLFRFLVIYGAGVVSLLYLLPIIGLFVEHQYETLSSIAKFFSVIGFFLVVGAWQIVTIRDRLRAEIRKMA